MKKYDYSKVPRERLEAMARVSERLLNEQGVIVSNRELQEFLGVRENVRTRAKIMTKADFDREIGKIVRGEVQPPYGINYWEWTDFINLVNDSRKAPEEI